MAIAIIRGMRWTYGLKIGLAAALVILADTLFWGEVPPGAYGSIIGVFALAWAMASGAGQRAVWKKRASLFTLGLSGLMGGILLNEPSFLGWLLFWSALAIAVLLPRINGAGDAMHWFWRLIVHGFTSLFGPLLDLRRVTRIRRRTGRISIAAMLPNLVLPLVGGLAFLILFALANPIISDGLAEISLAGFDLLTIFRCIFAGLVLVMVWATLRPRQPRLRVGFLKDSEARTIAGVNPVSVTISLVLFNAIFALQNGLDIAFIWSGARLPEAYTLAEYAHRGAYPLVGTALLAGLFILITTHPKSEMASNQLIRGLVLAWIAQNIFLVASTVARLELYVESYSLTITRIAAALWMGLVAVGLILVCWRMMRNKSLPWLVNGNAIAALALLTGCAFADLGGIAARWNVNHAREVDGNGATLDLCYLYSLGASSVVPLWELEQRSQLDIAFRDRVRNVRRDLQQDLVDAQANWRSWTVRGAMRLSQLPQDRDYLPDRAINCDGGLDVPNSSPAVTPLTEGAPQ